MKKHKHPIEDKLPHRRSLGKTDILMISVALIILLLAISGTVKAASTNTKNGCARTDAMSPTGGTITIIIKASGISACVQNNYASNVLDIDYPSGSPVSLTCTAASAGTLPPTAPTTITVSGYADNANLGGGGTPLWTQSVGTCTTNSAITTEFLTTNGLVGGTPKAGPVRLFVSIALAGPTGYACNSDDAGTQTPPTSGTCNSAGTTAIQGMWRGNPGFTSPNLTSTDAGANNNYVGGNTLRSSLTSNATEYVTSTRTTSSIAEGSNTFKTMGSAYNIAIGATTEDVRVMGGSSTWVQGPSSLLLKWTESGNAALSTYSALSYWTFTTATVPGSMSITSKTTTTFDPTDNLDRTLTATGACTVAINGATGVGTVAIRKDAVTVTACSPWKDQQGSNVPNNQPARGWYQFTSTYRSTADYPSFDGLFASGGTFPTAMQSTISATVSSASAYHKMVEEFDTTARSDAVLLNWGNTTGVFDVSANGIITTVFNGKNGGANASSFTIGADIENVQVRGASNQAGQFTVSVNMTCQRTLPDQITTQPSVSMGATDASGNSNTVNFNAEQPQGTWTNTCTGSMNGNTWSYTIGFFHTSAFTANIEAPVTWNVTQLGNLTLRINITACLRELDQNSDSVLAIFPDDDVKLTVQNYDVVTKHHDIYLVNRTEMTKEDGPSSTCYDYLFYSSPDLVSQGAMAFAAMNFTGSPFLGAEGYIWKNASVTTTQGNFTGNFTGVVTDTSAIPVSVAAPLVFYILTLGLAILMFAMRNLWITLLCFLIQVFQIFLIQQVASSIDSNTLVVLYALMGAGTIIAVVRFIQLGWEFAAGRRQEQRLSEEREYDSTE